MQTSTHERSFLDALKIQARVIGAIFRWEVIQRFGRDNLGFLWLFLEPMIFTLAVTALWSATRMAVMSNLPIVAFALTGYSSILLWRNSASRCCMAVQAYLGLLFHRPVRIIDVLATKVLLESAGATMSFFVLSVLWISIGWAEPPEEIMLVLASWAMLMWFAMALGMCLGALTSLTEIAERLWHPTAYILFPLSGAAFMVDWLTGDFREAILWLPMVHCVELLRHGYFGSLVSTHYDMQYVGVFNLVLTGVGLVLVKIASRRVDFK